MTKKILAIVLATSLFSFYSLRKSPNPPKKSPAPMEEEEPSCVLPAYDFLIEAKAGYFFFSSEMMRKIYDKGGLDLQLSFAYSFWKPLQLYASVEYLHREGRSAPLNEKTTFTAVPLSLGLQCLWNISACWPVDYYFTLGPRYFFVNISNHSSFVPRHMHANGLGGFANTGFIIHATDHLRVDLFGEYSYKRMAFHTSKAGVTAHTVQIGGYTFGGGLGYSF